MPETKLSLHRKLAQVMYEAERIPKNGTAPQVMGGYKFVQVGDAADYIRKALAEKVITMMPTAVHVTGQVDRLTKNGGNMTTVDLVTEWTLTDGESGESITIMSYGSGADAGDKYSGKASTSAMKYALLTGFLLSTGDDTEAHDTTGQRPPPARLPARTDPATQDPAPTSDPYTEQEEMVGRVRRKGTIRVGTAEGYKLDSRIGPDGRVIGFRLEVGPEKHIPQCLVMGPLGDALFTVTGGKPETLKGVTATVAGILYHVKNNRPDGQSWYRLHVDAIETTVNGLEVVLPADEALPEPPDDLALVGEKVPA